MGTRPRFNIIENPEDPPYEAIKKEYENLDLKVEDIREKYNLNSCKWTRILERFRAEGVRMRVGKVHAKYSAYDSQLLREAWEHNKKIKGDKG